MTTYVICLCILLHVNFFYMSRFRFYAQILFHRIHFPTLSTLLVALLVGTISYRHTPGLQKGL